MRNLFTTLVLILFAFQVSAQCTASFNLVQGPGANQATLTNTSTWTPVPGSTPMFYVNWGDGPNIVYISPTQSLTHTYTTPGTYSVYMHMIYTDSLNNFTLICADSLLQQVTVANSPCASTFTSTDLGNGNFSFSATNVGGATNPVYAWDFGDGNSATGQNVNHTYTQNGAFTVTLTTTDGPACTSQISSTVNVFTGTINCSQYNASIYNSVSNLNVLFTNASTQVNIPGANIYRQATWDFGDGNGVTTMNINYSHNYAAAGTYNVQLINRWVDTFNQIVYCIDTAYTTVTTTTPPPPPNLLDGYIMWDSTLSWGSATFKVWLIEHDSAANTLTAVDSTIVQGWPPVHYVFNGPATGAYRVKAAVMNGSPGGQGLIPTYHDSVLYWNQASLILHSGGSSTGNHIMMRTGTVTSGPGFIGGNISQGANKGTTGGVPNLLVILRDANDNLVKFTYTDMNGDYAFSNIGAGTFTVYPELMNWYTTPSAPIVMTGAPTLVNAINFKKTTTEIIPVTQSVAGVEAASLASIFPNPSQGLVTIRWNGSQMVNVQVFDVTGRMVAQTQLNPSQEQTLELDHLNTGLYLFKLSNDQVAETHRILINK